VGADAQGAKGIVITPSPRVLAPDWRARVRAAPPVAWMSVAILVVVGAVSNPRLSGLLVPLATVVVLFAIPNLTARANARLILYQDVVIYRGPLRRVQRCSRPAVKRIVRVRLAVLGPRFPLTHLLFLNDAGRSMISLPEEWWSTQDIERVRVELGVPIDTLSESVSPGEANRRFPGAASFGLVHRVAIGAVALGIVGLILLCPWRRRRRRALIKSRRAQ